MLSHVNSWLLVLSFALGLALTLAFMIRRVKREMPIYGALAAGAVKAGATKPKATSKSETGYSESKTEVIALPETGEAKTEVISLPDNGAPETKATLLPETGEAKTEAFSLPEVGEPETKAISLPEAGEAKTETISLPGAAVTAGAAGLVGGAALAGKGDKGGSGEEPYGAGSFRLVGGASVPSGWTIKGNEDSMLYHTTDSPSYEQTIAEVWFRDEPTAQAAGFTRWDKGRASGGGGIAALADVPAGRHGPGSATPGAGGSGPQGWTIKGNEDSMLYHTTDSPSYKRTIAEVWFRDVPTAEAAGFNRWDSGKSQRDES